MLLEQFGSRFAGRHGFQRSKRRATSARGITDDHLAGRLLRESGMSDKLKVLVPVDFSETSRRALAWAFDYAMRAPCEIHLAHVVEEHIADVIAASEAVTLREHIQLLAEQAGIELRRMVPDAVERASIGPIFRHVAMGKPTTEILRLAERIGADMVVMGTHGRSGLAGMFIGSVAEKIVRHANCPVVCVKPGRPAARVVEQSTSPA